MIFSIALNVGAYFLFPKFRIVLWPHKIVTALMPVPETTVYKDHSLIFGKNNIRFSWKPSVIFSVSESLRKQVFSDKFFWFSILSTNNYLCYYGYVIVQEGLYMRLWFCFYSKYRQQCGISQDLVQYWAVLDEMSLAPHHTL